MKTNISSKSYYSQHEKKRKFVCLADVCISNSKYIIIVIILIYHKGWCKLSDETQKNLPYLHYKNRFVHIESSIMFLLFQATEVQDKQVKKKKIPATAWQINMLCII